MSTQQGIFSGLSFGYAGFNEQVSAKLESCLQSQGGIIVRNQGAATRRCEYLVLPHQYPETETESARRKYFSNKIVSTNWVDRCLLEGKLLPVSQHSIFTPIRELAEMKSVSLSVSQYTAMEKEEIEAVSQLLGAGITKEFTRKNTHLISKTASGSKYTAAIKWGIPVVDAVWIFDTATLGKPINHENYILGSEIKRVTISPLSPQSGSMSFLGQEKTPEILKVKQQAPTPIEDKFLRGIQVAVETVNTHTKGSNGTICIESPVQQDHHRTSVLAGCTICFSKRLRGDLEMTQLVEKMGGRLVIHLDNTCTHLVYQKDQKTSDAKDVADAKKIPGIKIVSPHWIKQCWETKIRLEEASFPPAFNPNFQLGLSTGEPCKILDAKGHTNENQLSGTTENTTATKMSSMLDRLIDGQSRAPISMKPKTPVIPRNVCINLEGDPDSAILTPVRPSFSRSSSLLTTEATMTNSPELDDEFTPSQSVKYHDESSLAERERFLERLKRSISDENGSVTTEEVHTNTIQTAHLNAGSATHLYSHVGKGGLVNGHQPLTVTDSGQYIDDRQTNTASAGLPTELRTPIQSNDESSDVYSIRNTRQTSSPQKSGVEPTSSMTKNTSPIRGKATKSMLTDVSSKTEIAAKRTRHNAFRFMISGFQLSEKSDIAMLSKKLGAEVIEDQNFNVRCTHIISNTPTRSQKYLGALSCGRWILRKDYIYESSKSGYFLQEEPFEWSEEAIDKKSCKADTKSLASAARRWRELLNHRRSMISEKIVGCFSGWKVLLHVDQEKREGIQNILESGGAVVVPRKPPFKDLHVSSILYTSWLGLWIIYLSSQYFHVFLSRKLSCSYPYV
eukprot:TRINITY_DN8484_c0_g1_i3.p1 TRINITY_DN8484_c0_g1~~TRINITY_DN8484_c0_g1_i3.p1  ORF type:complete len:847 (+),score=115.92 TRINITY_DN8484_c0_g1_i3:54-2594(+)